MKYQAKTLEKIIFGNPISAKMLENSIKHSVVDAPAFDSHQIIDQLIESLIESIGKLLTRLVDVSEDLMAQRTKIRKVLNGLMRLDIVKQKVGLMRKFLR